MSAKIIDEKCITCGACVYHCPFGAITDRSSIVQVIEALKEALEKAYKKNTDPDALCRVDINSVKGTIEMFEQKNVVEEVNDDLYEIELEEALKIIDEETFNFSISKSVDILLELKIPEETIKQMILKHFDIILICFLHYSITH